MSETDMLDEFKVYPKRFLIVILFALSQFMISVLLNTLTPIASSLRIIYDQKPIVINLGALLFALMHPIFTFPASFVIDTYGTRVGIALGCSLGIIGVSLRMLVNSSFAWVIVGQVIAGIGRPFILNCQAKISANWFSAKTRGAVTQNLSLVLNVSLVIGILIPGIFFHNFAPDVLKPETITEGRNRTWKLMLVETILAILCFLPNIFLQDNKPPTPPSESGNIVRQPFKEAIPRMLKNKNFILMLLAFGCFFGIFNAISIVLSYLIKPFFKAQQLSLAVSAVGGSPVISGIIGVMVIGPIQRRQGKFKKWIIICMLGSMLAILLFYPFLLTKNIAVVSFISAFNSFFLIPLVPIMLELGCELVFPVGQGSAVGMLFAVGNFFGFLLGTIMSLFVKGQSRKQSIYGLLFCFGVFLLGLILINFMKEEKNREKAQSEYSENRRKIRQSEGQDSLRESLISSEGQPVVEDRETAETPEQRDTDKKDYDS